MKLGKAKYGSKKQYFKVKDGSQTYRILPPMGELADDGVWSRYYRINYGYVNTENKSRPFESSLVKNQKKMVEIPDAAVERFDKLKASYEDAAKRGDTKTKEALLPLVGGPKSRYNVDSNHYMNAVDLQGNIGILKLRHKCKQQLDIAIRELRDKGIDPLGVDTGRFFVFTRTGTRNETAFNVKVYQKSIFVENVGEVNQDVIHKLDDGVISRLESEAGELDKLFKKPSSEQIAQIVRESDIKTGVSPNIDVILGYTKDDSAGDGEAEAEETSNPALETADPIAAALANPSPVSTKTETTQPAPSQPKVSAKVETTSAPTPTSVETTSTSSSNVPQTTAEKVADMSDSEFLASLGIS